MPVYVGSMSRLTSKMEKFCHEYLIDLNATRAAIRAGYSKKTARVIGPENLIKPAVAERIAELSKKRVKATDITAEKVLQAIADISYDVDEKTQDRLRALEMLAKHLGLMQPDLNLTGINVTITNQDSRLV